MKIVGSIALVALALAMSASPAEAQRTAARKKAPAAKIAPEAQAALDRISADSMRGHLSFLASDLLEGRNTPSKGLDIAAEYVAAQFRRAGLEPAGDAAGKSYFQTSEWVLSEVTDRFATLTTDEGKQRLRASRDQLRAYGVDLSPPPPASASGAAAPPRPKILLRNVIGVLRGSDPALKETYVLVSGHYDHIGVRPEGDGDRISNGANDDGSGTVSVIELASALASMKQRPKRSLVFIAWFGEEKGLQGSRYYGRHPLFPLDKTVAMVNLEHMGRTDDSEGAQLASATMTGFDFTDLGPIFKAAGEKTGIRVYKHEKNSDAFFPRSDNQALADAGVPAHTICVAFIFPDYHGVGDHWEKVDYENMARVDRMIGLALLTIANNPVAPKWNEENKKTEKYVKAWKALTSQ
ncbi:MAG: M20/M25/M40 family metallo-hydrolase [Blastocatellia bacterium]|nr:M20/M25/M40 family metallo-hydrolase [Blastocatellia bacterium]